MERKKILVEQCKILVDSLKDEEAEVALRGRKIYSDIEAAIEQDRKSFRSGQEDRLQKVLSYVKFAYEFQFLLPHPHFSSVCYT